MKTVLVTGILGQDGANMAEYLLSMPSNYKVLGMLRRSANPNFVNIKAFKDHPRFELVWGDLSDAVSIYNIVKNKKPDYFINFAANSFVGVSWTMPVQVMDINTLGVLRCLEAIRKFKPHCRFYSAGSSEEWGDIDYSPQDMKHPIKPRSPYGASKAAARHLVKVYRESYGLYAVHGILFNHEGTKRGEEFVTRKITKGVARIKNEIENNIDTESPSPIELGFLDSKRDWSDSEDFVKGVWLMLNQENSPRRHEFNEAFNQKLDHYRNDAACAIGGSDLDGIEMEAHVPLLREYILASGETHSIREFVELAFEAAGINGYWQGTGLEERYIYKNSPHGHSLVVINEKFYRPAEVNLLLGDSLPIQMELGWTPEVSFDKLVKKMVDYDIDNYHARET
jgi:GDPmannose 4,6-dehydratase